MPSAPVPRAWRGYINSMDGLSPHGVIFARAPVAGECKTRLVPALGSDGAARLQERLIRRTVATAVAAMGPCVELCITPDAGHPLFVQLSRRHGIASQPQGEGDLGARMARAARRVLADGQAVILLGTDCPGYDESYIAGAVAALAAGADAVLGPAQDGGYVLLGLRRFDDALFTGIDWGSERVLAQTRSALARAGMEVVELPPLHDIDRPEDLARFPELLNEVAHAVAG